MLNSASPNQLPGPPHFVDLHVNPGESVSIQYFDGNETVLRGPITIQMISQHAYPPMPMPVQVPPGHMIQQIVDENGTLRHIILSTLNSNGNNFSNSFVSNQQSTSSTSQYCCCCNNACSSNTQTSPMTNQHLQSPLTQNPISLPLNQTYVRHRRSNRYYSSSSKRTNFNANYSYSTSASTKVPSRHTKLDNVKPNHYNRFINHYDPNRSYDPSNKNDFYLSKSYDNCCNSSNASQTSTLDQMNDSTKYYKEENFSIEEDFSKKSYDCNEFKSTQELKSCYMDYNHEDLSNYPDNSSQKSFSENIDHGADYVNPNVSTSFDVSFNCSKVLQDTALVSHAEVNDQSQSNENAGNTSANFISDVCLQNGDIGDNFSNDGGDDLSKSISDTTHDDTPTYEKGQSCEKGEEVVTSDVAQLAEKNENSVTVEESKSEEPKPLANGNIEHYLSMSGSVIQANDSVKTEFDDSDKESNVSHSNSLPLQRSPKHLLPKIEMINLTYSFLTSNSVRLKWAFNNCNELSDHKKHYIVDMLLNKPEDSPNTRMVHQGHTTSCRISHLHPQQEYTFRIRTSTETAILVSNHLTIITPEPPAINSSKSIGRKSKQQSQQHHVQQHQQQLFHHNQHQQQRQISGEEQDSASRFGAALSPDQRFALLILLGFTFFALVVAVLIQNLLSSN